MSGNKEIVTKNETKEQNNLFSLFPNFGFKFPFPKPEPKKEAAGVVGLQENQSEKGKARDVVTFPQKQSEPSSPLRLEAEEQSGKTSNPVILWQVYALGGFLILKWVWGRWQERKARKGKDDEDTSDQVSPDDDPNFH